MLGTGALDRAIAKRDQARRVQQYLAAVEDRKEAKNRKARASSRLVRFDEMAFGLDVVEQMSGVRLTSPEVMLAEREQLEREIVAAEEAFVLSDAMVDATESAAFPRAEPTEEKRRLEAAAFTLDCDNQGQVLRAREAAFRRAGDVLARLDGTRLPVVRWIPACSWTRVRAGRTRAPGRPHRTVAGRRAPLEIPTALIAKASSR